MATGEELARQVECFNRFDAAANVSYGAEADPLVLLGRFADPVFPAAPRS